MKTTILNTIFQCSAIALVLGAATYTFIPVLPPYLFAAGALGMWITRLLRHYEGGNVRLRRLYRQETMSSFIFMGAAVLMFWKESMDWVVFFIIGTVLQIYAAILIPREEAKEK